MSEQALSNFINGQWQAGHGETIVTVNPANGQQTYASQQSTATDVAQAAQAARAAFDAWAYRPLEERVAKRQSEATISKARDSQASAVGAK